MLSVTIRYVYAPCVVVIHVEKKKLPPVTRRSERIHFQKRCRTDELTGVRNPIALRKRSRKWSDTSGTCIFSS